MERGLSDFKDGRFVGAHVVRLFLQELKVKGYFALIERQEVFPSVLLQSKKKADRKQIPFDVLINQSPYHRITG